MDQLTAAQDTPNEIWWQRWTWLANTSSALLIFTVVLSEILRIKNGYSNSCTFSCPEHLEPWGGRFRPRWGLETSVAVLPIYTVGVSSVNGPWHRSKSLASNRLSSQPPKAEMWLQARGNMPQPRFVPALFPPSSAFEWGTQPSTASIHYLQKEPQAGKKTQHPWWNSNVSPILRNCLPSQSKDAQSSITCQDGAGYHLGFQHPSTMIDRKRDSNSQGHVTAFVFCTNPTKNPNPTPLATLASPITVLQIKLTPTTEIQEHPRTSYQFHDQIWPCAKGHLLPAPSTRLASLRSWLLTAKRWASKWCLQPTPCCIPQFSLMIYCVSWSQVVTTSMIWSPTVAAMAVTYYTNSPGPPIWFDVLLTILIFVFPKCQWERMGGQSHIVGNRRQFLAAPSGIFLHGNRGTFLKFTSKMHGRPVLYARHICPSWKSSQILNSILQWAQAHSNGKSRRFWHVFDPSPHYFTRSISILLLLAAGWEVPTQLRLALQ